MSAPVLLATQGKDQDASRRVLVIDDDRDYAESLVDLLEPHGYSSAVAANLAEAILRCEEDEPAVALVDLRLGRENGIDVVERLSARWPQLVCVMVTAYGDVDSAVRAIKRGAYDYLQKPVSDSDLIRSLDRALEKARLEREKAQLYRQLLQAQKLEMLAQLAGGVVHDFNNLLTAIAGHTELACSLIAPGHPALASLEQVTEAVKQAAAVTRGLLTFGGDAESEKGPVDLTDVVEKSILLMRRMIPAAVEIVTDIARDHPLLVYGDATRLQQVVMNLAINARDAMPEGGTLRMAVYATSCAREESGASEAAPPEIVLRVSDTGVGMSSETLARFREPFFTTKPRGKGTGLGMAIVDGIVRDHGAQIDVESEPGCGATFTLSFPGLSAGVTKAPRRLADLPPQAHGELILFAEDDPQVRRVVVNALEAYGYQVRQADDGQVLLHAMEEHAERVCVVITDLDMPRRSGLSALQELRARGSRVPVILMTGAIDEDMEGQLDEDTILLRKPFHMQELVQLVGSRCQVVQSVEGGT